MCTTLQSVFDFDTDKDFLEQIDTVKENIKLNSIKTIIVMSLIGINVISDDTTYIDSDFLNKLELEKENFENSFKSFLNEMGA